MASINNSNATCVDVMEDLSQYIVFHEASETPYWCRESTLALIECYRKNRPRVGTEGFRRMNKMWDAMSIHIKRVLGKYFTAAQCENKWRVLERNYKKVIDNNKSSGRGRKTFQFFKEMEEVFHKKANVHPELLLSGSVVAEAPETDAQVPESDTVFEESQQYCEPVASGSGASGNVVKENVCPPPPPQKRKSSKKRSPREALLEDRQSYHRQRLKMDEERNKERERREEENLQTNKAVLESLKEANALHTEMIKHIAELTNIFRKYTEYRMSVSGFRYQ